MEYLVAKVLPLALGYENSDQSDGPGEGVTGGDSAASSAGVCK